MSVRRAGEEDAGVVGALLDAFNREFGDESPGAEVLAGRLRALLPGGGLVALLAGEPAEGVALLSLRRNVWYDGPVALLDELYVVPGRRSRGTGTALLRAAEAEVRALGGEVLEINVDGEDTDARRFYERHGYRNVEPGRDDPMLYYYRELDHDRELGAEPHRDDEG